MRTRRAIEITLPVDLLRKTERLAKEETRSRNAVIRDALQQYIVSHRWRRLRQWGSATATRIGLKTDADLERLLDKPRPSLRKAR